MTAIAISSRCEPGPWAHQNPGPSPGLGRDLIHSLGNSCMVDEPHAPGTKQRSPESRTGPAPTYSAHSALIQSLQSLRERVLERLLSLETLAQSRSVSAQGSAASAERERTLDLKVAELAETERRLDDQAARQEKEWSASLIKLESDRRLLAEAWERIERERIACSSQSETHHHGRAQGQGLQKGGLTDLPHAGALVTARSAAADSDMNHPVTQAILRQFQTLSSDVRRNAAERRDSR